jgi:hypothetical protein
MVNPGLFHVNAERRQDLLMAIELKFDVGFSHSARNGFKKVSAIHKALLKM